MLQKTEHLHLQIATLLQLGGREEVFLATYNMFYITDISYHWIGFQNILQLVLVVTTKYKVTSRIILKILYIKFVGCLAS